MDAVRHLARRLQRALFAGRRGAHLRADAAAEATTVSWKPGDRKPVTEAMIRVDQAGEYGATRIYAGQLAVMGDRTPVARSNRKSTRLNSSHSCASRMPASA